MAKGDAHSRFAVKSSAVLNQTPRNTKSTPCAISESEYPRGCQSWEQLVDDSFSVVGWLMSLHLHNIPLFTFSRTYVG